ncbi:MAG: hypothetical protein EUB_03739 [Eubacterium sp.]
MAKEQIGKYQIMLAVYFRMFSIKADRLWRLREGRLKTEKVGQ